jgi:hypothetical protein
MGHGRDYEQFVFQNATLRVQGEEILR